MNIHDVFQSNYLKSADLKGQSVRVQIDRIETEEVGRDKEAKPILYFIGKKKGMVLNRTNATTIASAYGPEMDNWHQVEIELYVAIVEFGGKSTEGLRVRIPPRQPERRPVPPQPNGPSRQTAPAMDDEAPF